MVEPTMNNTQLVQDLDRSIKEAKKIVDLSEALTRLGSNRDFRKVIEEGYFEKEAVRLVHLKADPNMQTAEYQAKIVKDIDAIGSLSQFFVTIKQMANIASRALVADEETRSELLQGE